MIRETPQFSMNNGTARPEINNPNRAASVGNIMAALILPVMFLPFFNSPFKPLNEDQISSLAAKRRAAFIRNDFVYDNMQRTANEHFQRSMIPSGRYYDVDQSRYETPAIAASQLKGLAHEWVYIAFISDDKVKHVWLNRGMSELRVEFGISIQEIKEKAKLWNITSIFIFHNHPVYGKIARTAAPSKLDIRSAKELAADLNNVGVNVAEFVCAKGLHHEYLLSAIPELYPLEPIILELREVNDDGWSVNFRLHMERLFRITYPTISG